MNGIDITKCVAELVTLKDGDLFPQGLFRQFPAVAAQLILSARDLTLKHGRDGRLVVSSGARVVPIRYVEENQSTGPEAA